jgi:hypothetical protein
VNKLAHGLPKVVIGNVTFQWFKSPETYYYESLNGLITLAFFLKEGGEKYEKVFVSWKDAQSFPKRVQAEIKAQQPNPRIETFDDTEKQVERLRDYLKITGIEDVMVEKEPYKNNGGPSHPNRVDVQKRRGEA